MKDSKFIGASAEAVLTKKELTSDRRLFFVNDS